MGVKEKVLTAVESITSGDFLRVVTSAGYARKIDYNKLAKAIVENYAGSSLAGSSQSLKAAIDSLNSNTPEQRYSLNSGSLDDLTAECRTIANLGNVENGPRDSGWWFIENKRFFWEAGGIPSIVQIAIPTSGANVYTRVSSNNSWNTWLLIK